MRFPAIAEDLSACMVPKAATLKPALNYTSTYIEIVKTDKDMNSFNEIQNKAWIHYHL